jgi:cob(I)alamin adenosyltransferase
MKIYTRIGDGGTTSLFGGRRVSKSDPQIDAYGTVDELSSFIGLLIAKIPSAANRQFLTDVQRNLYVIMSSFSRASTNNSAFESAIQKLEKKIDEIYSKLPKLTHFVLPQGSDVSALAHVVRTVCRRAERAVVKTSSQPSSIKYLNRLSDFFFVLARLYNKKEVFARK